MGIYMKNKFIKRDWKQNAALPFYWIAMPILGAGVCVVVGVTILVEIVKRGFNVDRAPVCLRPIIVPFTSVNKPCGECIICKGDKNGS